MTHAESASFELKRRALTLGFDAAGVATLEPDARGADLDRWLAAGHAGTMTYLHRQAAKRKDPRRIMPGATVAVVTLTNYCHDPPTTRTTVSGAARVAQYAWSSDYHRVLRARLERLADEVRRLTPGARTRCYVDAGPLPERELARRAGLGWPGKNTMLISPRIGSYTFIGTVLTDADLAPDLPFGADRCGTCHACLDACPTQALLAPHTLDARRCISYLTIEYRGDFSTEQRANLGGWVFGCDVCQDVCPWNDFAPSTRDPELTPRPALAHPDLDLLLNASDAEFNERYGDTAFERPGVAGMRRNAAARTPG